MATIYKRKTKDGKKVLGWKAIVRIHGYPTICKICDRQVETAFSRMKGLFGERLSSKKLDNQRLEVGMRCTLLNKMIRSIDRG